MSLLYEGKAKKLFTTDRPDELLMEFKNSATAFNGVKKAEFDDKGRLNKALTVRLYQLLEKQGVKTHLVRDAGEISLIVRPVEIVKLEVVVRNVIAGSLAKRTGRPEGTVLREPIVEWYYKDDDLGDPIVNEDHIREMELATPAELVLMREAGLTVNRLLTDIFGSAGLRLIDFKLEFGRTLPDRKEIVLADEISPDTCRLWDAVTNEKMDKDRFRQDLGGVMEKYAEVLKRVEHATGS